MELDYKTKVGLIRGFLRQCDWYIDGDEGSIGYTVTLDKFGRFRDSTGHDFSVLWDELTDDEQFQIMQECSGLHTQFCSN